MLKPYMCTRLAIRLCHRNRVMSYVRVLWHNTSCICDLPGQVVRRPNGLWPCGFVVMHMALNCMYKANELGNILAVYSNPSDLDWSGTLSWLF